VRALQAQRHRALSDCAGLTAKYVGSRVWQCRTHGSIGDLLANPEIRVTSGLPHRVPLSGPSQAHFQVIAEPSGSRP
jgi:hypothetical protein